MLIGLIGPRASGKKTVSEELSRRRGFIRIVIDETANESSGTDNLLFRSPQAALDFTTSNWTLDFVTTNLRTCDDILPFLKRPWFVLVSLQARLLDRWARIQAELNSDRNLTFEQFVIKDDLDEFGARTSRNDEKEELGAPINGISDGISAVNLEADWKRERRSPLRALSRHVSYSITNELPLSDFLGSLESIHLPIIRKLVRPCWDTYFTALANLASLRSNCMKRRVGAVLVTQDNRIVSTGYNGTPRGMLNCNQGGCARCNGQNSSPNQLTNTNVVASCGVNLDECLCLHAEENALLEAGRDRITNSRLYCNTCPCLRCTIKIVQCGVQEVIYSQSYSMDEQARKIFLQSGVKLRQFD